MTLPRCLLHFTKQYLPKRCLLQSKIKPTYCQLYHNYSSNVGSTDTKPVRKFTERHEWIQVVKDVGTVGISKYAQESLGDVVFAQLPQPESIVTEGEECGALESVKAASEIYSPVTGIVTEKNKEVENKPSLINTNYYDKGWLFKVKLTRPEELQQLMTEEQYNDYLKTDVKETDT